MGKGYPILAILVSVLLSSCGSSMSSRELTETQSRFDEIGIGIDPGPYVRFYSRVSPTDVNELPFTTIKTGLDISDGQEVVVSVWVRPDVFELSPGDGGWVAVLPQFVHGGCAVINTVFAADGRVLDSWCNAD